MEEAKKNSEKSACSDHKQVPDQDKFTDKKMQSNFTGYRQTNQEDAENHVPVLIRKSLSCLSSD